MVQRYNNKIKITTTIYNIYIYIYKLGEKLQRTNSLLCLRTAKYTILYLNDD